MKEIKPAYVTFEQAKLFEEKGILRPFWVENYYRKSRYDLMRDMKGETFNSDIHIFAPEQWQVVEWFEIKHGITIDTIAEECDDGDSGDGPMYEYRIQDWRELKRYYSKEQYLYRKEAYSAAFDYVLTNNLI